MADAVRRLLRVPPPRSPSTPERASTERRRHNTSSDRHTGSNRSQPPHFVDQLSAAAAAGASHGDSPVVPIDAYGSVGYDMPPQEAEPEWEGKVALHLWLAASTHAPVGVLSVLKYELGGF